jgi:hypothetical protein
LAAVQLHFFVHLTALRSEVSDKTQVTGFPWIGNYRGVLPQVGTYATAVALLAFVSLLLPIRTPATSRSVVQWLAVGISVALAVATAVAYKRLPKYELRALEAEGQEPDSEPEATAPNNGVNRSGESGGI